MRVRIAPSLLAADFAHLARELTDVQDAGADLIHLDIMDGCFVPNLTFGPTVVRQLAPHCRIPLDAHLMVNEPDALVPELAEAGVARIAVHVEACRHLHRTIDRIRELGIEAGVAINPATSLALLQDAIPYIDFVVVMSVNPGFGGQDFLPQSVDKIRRLRALCAERAVDLTVDGGVAPDNALALVAAGATTLVAGSAVFGAQDRRQAIQELRRSVAGATPR